MTMNDALANAARSRFASIENSIWYQAFSLQLPYSAISERSLPLRESRGLRMQGAGGRERRLQLAPCIPHPLSCILFGSPGDAFIPLAGISQKMGLVPKLDQSHTDLIADYLDAKPE